MRLVYACISSNSSPTVYKCNVTKFIIYVAPLQGINSEAPSALTCMMSNVIMNEYVQSISKNKHSRLKESPVVCPCTRVEPAIDNLHTCCVAFRSTSLIDLKSKNVYLA